MGYKRPYVVGRPHLRGGICGRIRNVYGGFCLLYGIRIPISNQDDGNEGLIHHEFLSRSTSKTTAIRKGKSGATANVGSRIQLLRWPQSILHAVAEDLASPNH
jgi:hypothetical protein